MTTTKKRNVKLECSTGNGKLKEEKGNEGRIKKRKWVTNKQKKEKN